jgi:hypothetical protein
MTQDLIRKFVENIDGPPTPKEDTMEARLERFARRMGYAAHVGEKRLLQAVFDAKRGAGPKVIVVECGKQSGKSDTLADIFADEFEFHNPGAHVWVASGTYEFSEIVYNRAIPLITKVMGKPDGHSNHKPKFREWSTGGFFRSRSWQEPDVFEGEQLDLLGCDEAQSLDEERRSRIRPRMLRREGITILVGSPWETTEYWNELVAEARAESTKEKPSMVLVEWTTEDNPNKIIQEMLVQERQDLDPDLYAQLYLHKARSLSGLVFPKFDRNIHVRECPFDPELPVTLSIDPGQRTYAVSAVQFHGREVHVIDEVYMEHTNDVEVITACGQREWWYKVGDLVIDREAIKMMANSAQSTADNWLEYAGKVARYQYVPIDAGIMRLDSFLMDPRINEPRIFFDPKNARTIREFGLHRRNAQGGIIDDNNHAIKEIIYLLVDRYGPADVDSGPRQHKYFGPSWRNKRERIHA